MSSELLVYIGPYFEAPHSSVFDPCDIEGRYAGWVQAEDFKKPKKHAKW